jgi:hypothetical protein
MMAMNTEARTIMGGPRLSGSMKFEVCPGGGGARGKSFKAALNAGESIVSVWADWQYQLQRNPRIWSGFGLLEKRFRLRFSNGPGVHHMILKKKRKSKLAFFLMR